MQEDGITILYEVFNLEKKCGDLKVLSLGIEQIARTCKQWEWNIANYKIKRISDGAIVWSGDT